MAESHDTHVDRRKFLKQAATGAVALTSQATVANAQPAPAQSSAPAAAAPETARPEQWTQGRTGSDFMVDILKSLGFEYVCSNPGSSFRAIQESIVNYGGNSKPEFITCCHEEASVAMAQGYFKVEGKPLAVLAHGTVGLQHAAMAVYNAYCDRAPVYLILGNTLDATTRVSDAEWQHSVQDAVAMSRDCVKWDDTPISLQHFAESSVRAYKVAMTPPYGPVALVADTELQEQEIAEGHAPRIPKLTLASPPQGDAGAIAEVARLLVAAENPVLVADRAARTEAGVRHLVELAELLQASVINLWARMNYPTHHPLNQTLRSAAVIADADLIVGLEVGNFYGLVNRFRDQIHRTSQPVTKPGVKMVNITANDLFMKSNYQDFQRYPELDLSVAGDAEATMPALIEAVKRLITPARRSLFEARGARLAAASRTALEAARTSAGYGWDSTPISTARAAAELWAQIKNEDWSLVSPTYGASSAGFAGWPTRLWKFEKYYHGLGGTGAGGIGYGAPGSVGAALANRKYGRLSVSIQNDGDLLYQPAALWTAAHHKIPLLSVMNNNRSYHQEAMHLQRMTNRRNRGIDRAHIGTEIDNPAIDYAKIAQGFGIYAEGPITNPNDLGPALKRAIAVVKRGEPALLDVVMQGR